ncbi:sensor histidine kinase [Nonomuraea soli]|uniref:Sensor-like histidine kinase SenX3 n=1 Tax=Nonomuraea soli TaxID=1032476 RepID=A0A7W0CDJ6_9ACTN|nr:HAMP domain-containing sensor histidine kinase [Nonomuraea soli]MBA2889197.1 signal transduction histidine kinase [Nonomuraea soli]
MPPLPRRRLRLTAPGGAATFLTLPRRWLWLAALAGAAACLALLTLAHPLPAAALAGVVAGALGTLAAARRTLLDRQAQTVRLTAQLQSRADQVSALGHELKTPLSTIKAAADMLQEGTLTGRQADFLRIIDLQCAQVIHLCESLLIHARLESGLFEPAFEQADLSRLTREVVAAMRPLCAQNDQRITLDTPQVTPEVRADPRLLQAAVTNLLANASRFTTVGGRIAVRVAVIDTGIALYVTDDGAGMTREQRRALFRPFATSRPLGDGTGLGLVLTKTIIELHGGAIMVDTAAMKGTTILVTVPR